MVNPATASGRSFWALAGLVGVIALVALCETKSTAQADKSAAARGATSPATNGATASTAPGTRRAYTTETIDGRVAWLAEALDRGFGVTTEPDAAHSSVALVTPAGKVWPLVPDTRGWAFAVDERLRNVDVRLLVRRYGDVPMLQVIRMFWQKDGAWQEVDYWCDICSIPMFILKPCECCQGATRLRERPVEGDPAGG
ncbi:MAG: hypothetical protein AB7O59_16445 [Pirellulales bacterium]